MPTAKKGVESTELDETSLRKRVAGTDQVEKEISKEDKWKLARRRRKMRFNLEGGRAE